MANVPLSVWLLATIVAKFVHVAQIKYAAEFIAAVFLFTWAYMELRSGASWFRRILGLVVGLTILISHIK